MPHSVLQHLAAAGLPEAGVIISLEIGPQIQTALADNPWGLRFTRITED